MPTDNTAALQTLLNAGNVILPAGSTYYVTGLTLLHNLDLNGSIINFTPTTGTCLKVLANNVTIKNGFLVGVWSYTTSNSTTGSNGIVSTHDNITITNMNISQFSTYGINQTGNNVVTTYNTITKIGSVGYFYNSGSLNTSNGIFAYNIIDRSMVSNTWTTGVTQPAAAIRGSSLGTQIATLWSIHDNQFIMPNNPIDWTAEGIELRYITNTAVYNNVFTNGSIGLSIINSANFCVNYNNSYTGQNLEALEIGSCTNNVSYNNTITGQLGVGILLDGTQTGNIIYNTTIDTCLGHCIQIGSGVTNLSITNSHLSIGANNKSAVYLSQAHGGISLTNVVISGSGYTGTRGIFFDTSLGGFSMTKGTISNCTYLVMVYAANVGTTTDNLTFTCVNQPTGFLIGNIILNTHGTLGSNLTFTNSGCNIASGILVNKKIILQ